VTRAATLAAERFGESVRRLCLAVGAGDAAQNPTYARKLK
jgi:hypothetical protein